MTRTIFSKNINPRSLQCYIDRLTKDYGVPAISLSVWYEGRLHAVSSGVLNVDTKVESTTDSIFQIGSVTKVFTATLVMQLVDAGTIDLSLPVRHYLRDFRVRDSNATENITIRHLLNHTNGLAGDFIVDHSGFSGNPLARYVDSCYLLPQVHPVGKYHSYSNAAYVIAGRLIEVVMGVSWFDAIEDHILKPLGLSYSFVKPSNGLRFRCAMGHLPDSNSQHGWVLASTCYPPLGLAPAGTTLSMSATDLLMFARAHLNDGMADYIDKNNSRQQARLLSCDSVQAMQTPNITLPLQWPSFVSDWGLGWFMLGGAECSVIGHDGGTIGQSCMLRLVPERNLAFVVQTNCIGSNVLKIISSDLLSLADLHFGSPERSGPAIAIDAITGTYESFDAVITVSRCDEDLVAVREARVIPFEQERWRLEIVDSNTAMAYSEKGECEANFTFLEPNAQGFTGYLYFGYRMHQRV